MPTNVDLLAKEIMGGLGDALGSGWNQVADYQWKKMQLIARQAGLIATSRATGSLKNDDEGFDYEVQGLKEQVKGMAIVIANLVIITIEKAFNAVMGVIWKAMQGFLDARGLGSLIPEKPPAL